MIPPTEFRTIMEKIKESLTKEMIMFSNIPNINELHFTITELCQKDVAEDMKKRSVLLLNLYVTWDKLNRTTYSVFHKHIIPKLPYELSNLFQRDFNLPDKTLFFDITRSIIQNDFKNRFYFHLPLENPYEIAYDLFSFSIDYPPTNTVYINNHSEFFLNIITNSKMEVFLEFIPKQSNYFFSKIDIKLADEIQEKDIVLYSKSKDGYQPQSFTQKIKLLEKYWSPMALELMFNMEQNRGFWGVKNFFIQRKFLENIVQLRKKKN